MEPTERSMPPVTMTKVMPMARKALSATCFDINTRLRRRQEIRRGEGKDDQHRKQRDESAQPHQVERQRAAAAAGGARISGSGHGWVPWWRVWGPWPAEEAATMAASVASARSRRAVRRPWLITAMRSERARASSRSDVTKTTPRPFAARLAHDAENIALGADVDAAARLVHQQDLGLGQQRLADHDLLLVAAGQRGDGQRGDRRP